VDAEEEEEEEEVPDGYIEVDSATTLAMIGTNAEYPLDGKYFQTKNITISGEWTLIGPDGTPFTGVYDGGGKKIFPTITSTANAGIFEYADGAIFNDVHIGTGSIISTGDYAMVGGIVGGAIDTTFTNCSNAADLSGEYGVGGICAFLQGGSIENCQNTGTITCKLYLAGGICGLGLESDSGNIIQNCYNSGAINGGLSAGGIVGDWWLGNIIACYNTGTVTAITTTDQLGANAGGIAGAIMGYETSPATITACYNTGNVSSSVPKGDIPIYIGGVTGNNVYKYGVITASYSTGNLSHTGDTSQSGDVYIGGVSGFSAYDPDATATITACYWTGTGTSNGIGYKATGSGGAASDEGATKFNSGSAWPTNSTHTDWGTSYWKSISNGVYPKLAWEQ
jgi:hypothetical protein